MRVHKLYRSQVKGKNRNNFVEDFSYVHTVGTCIRRMYFIIRGKKKMVHEKHYKHQRDEVCTHNFMPITLHDVSSSSDVYYIVYFIHECNFMLAYVGL